MWQIICLYNGFQTTCAHFSAFDGIQYDQSKRPGDLFQRMTVYVEDILLRTDIGISQHRTT